MKPTKATTEDIPEFDLKWQQTFEGLLPTLRPKELRPFGLGVAIALTNLPCDGEPDKLRREIEGLEADPATVSGESRMRLTGGKWAYQVLNHALGKAYIKSENIRCLLKELGCFAEEAQKVSVQRKTASRGPRVRM
jgi:hypothetical protein